MYEIYAYGNNEALFGIFNAITAVIGSDSYLGAIGIAVLFGFFTALVAYAFAPQKLIGWQWLASVVLVYSVLLVPKATVGIVDKLGTQPVQVVSNVPIGLVVFGHATSTVGNTLTQLFEAGFQTIPAGGALPQELTYQHHGLMFGSRLIKQTRTTGFSDPEFRTDLINYVANCTMYDLSDGTIAPATFASSTDVWSLMGTPNPARFSTITTGGTSNSAPCPDVYASLDQRLPSRVQEAQDRLGLALNPYLPPVAARAAVAAQIEQAYLKTSLGNAASTAADLIRQNALINSIADSSQLIGQRINDPASLLLGMARAQAVAATNAGWLTMGRIAEDALPLIRNGLEAIMFAFFPFVALLMMLSYGAETARALKSYVYGLIWLQLWPPAYAVLSYLGTLTTAKHIAAEAALGGGVSGLALINASNIYSTAISDQAVIGCLSLVGIPTIAWALLKGMDSIASAAITGVSMLQGAASSAGAAASSGNMSLGNVGFDQVQLAPQTSSAFMSSFSSAQGTQITGIGPDAGVSRFLSNISRLPTQYSFSDKQATALTESAREAESFSTSEREAASRSTAAALSSAVEVQQQYNRSMERSGGADLSTGAGTSSEMSALLQVGEQVNSRLGLEKGSTVGHTITGAISAGGSLPLKIFDFAARGTLDMHQVSDDQLKDAADFARDAVQRSGISDAKSLTSQFHESDAYRWAKHSGEQSADRLDSSMREAEEHSQASEKARLESQELSRAAQSVREFGQLSNQDATNFIVSSLQRTGRWGTYLRADPLVQQRMVNDLVTTFLDGGPGMNGKHVPYEGSRPTPVQAHLGWEKTPREAYTSTQLPDTVRNQAAANDEAVGERQRQLHVRPADSIHDDVTPQVRTGKGGIQQDIDQGRAGTAAEHNQRGKEYNQAIDPKAISRLHGGVADRVSSQPVTPYDLKVPPLGASHSAPSEAVPSPLSAWDAKTSPVFREKVAGIAERLHTDPQHLMGVMDFETAGSFSPSQTNPNSSAIGLIQFMPDTARGLGTSTEALRGMSAERQLDYVEKHLQPFAGRLNTIDDVYAAVIYPAAVGKPDDYVLFRHGTPEYQANAHLDRDGNRQITKADAVAPVKARLARR